MLYHLLFHSSLRTTNFFLSHWSVIPGAQLAEDNAVVTETKDSQPVASSTGVKSKRPYTRRINVKFPKEYVWLLYLASIHCWPLAYRPDSEEGGRNSAVVGDLPGIDAQDNPRNHVSDEEPNFKRARSGVWWSLHLRVCLPVGHHTSHNQVKRFERGIYLTSQFFSNFYFFFGAFWFNM